MKKNKLKIFIISTLLLIATLVVNPFSYNNTKSETLVAINKNNVSDISEMDAVKKLEVSKSSILSSTLAESYSVFEVLQTRANNETDATKKTELQNYLNNFIENQEQYGICYAISPLTILELNVALNHNMYYDFSEIHMATATFVEDGYSPYNDPDGNGLDFKSTGGNIYHLMSYLLKGEGPVLSEDMPFETYYSASLTSEKENLAKEVYLNEKNSANLNEKFTRPVTVNHVIEFPNVAELQSAEQVTARNLIKDHIQNYGAVMAEIYSGSGSMFTSVGGKTYLKDSASSYTDHMITIVGWDDNISVTLNGTSYTGAWLCANSWGDDWGNSGLFYAPYGINHIEEEIYGIEDCSLNAEVYSNAESLTGWRGTYYPFSGSDTTFINVIDLNNYLNKNIDSIDLSSYAEGYEIKVAFFNQIPTVNDFKATFDDNTTTISFETDDNVKENELRLNTIVNLLLDTDNSLDENQPLKITDRYAVIITTNYTLTKFFAFVPQTASPTTDEIDDMLQYTYWKNGNSLTKLIDSSSNIIMPMFRFHLSEDVEEEPVVPEPINYNINYILDEGTNSEFNSSTFSSTDSLIKLYEPTKQGYSFDGWYSQSDFDENSKILNSETDINGKFYFFNIETYQDFTFYAKWTEIPNETYYEISYVNDLLGGGTNNNITQFDNYTENITLHSPTHINGVRFLGWFKDENYQNILTYNQEFDYYTYDIEEYNNLTFYAKWELEPISILSQPEALSIVYNEKNQTVAVVASHPICVNEDLFVYNWYYKQDLNGEYQKIENATAKVLNVKNCNESGFYKCEISLTYQSLSTLVSTNEVKIEIKKANYDIAWVYNSNTPLYYNSTPHTITVKNANKYANLVITLQGNKETNAGTYVASAIISNSDSNYNTPTLTPLSWQIKPAEIEILIKDVNVFNEQSFNSFNSFDYQILGNIYGSYQLNPSFRLIDENDFVKRIELDSYNNDTNYKVSYISGHLKFVRQQITIETNERTFVVSNPDGFVFDAELFVGFRSEKDLPSSIQKTIEKKRFIIYDYLNIALSDTNLDNPSTISFDINENLVGKNIKVYQIKNNELVAVDFDNTNNVLSFSSSDFGNYIIVEAPEKNETTAVVVSLIIILVAGLFVCLAITGIRHKRKKKYSHSKKDTIIYH